MADLKEKGKTKVKSIACVVGLLCRWLGDAPPVRAGREEGDDPDPPVAGLRRRRHVDPRAASVPANSRRLPCSYCYVWGMYSVILELLRFCLVNFDFCSHCKHVSTGEKIVKEMCVFVFFLMLLNCKKSKRQKELSV